MESRSTPPVARMITWAGALVLIAGLVAFITVSLARNDTPGTSAGPSTLPDFGSDYDPDATVQQPKESDVPKAARVAAGEFVLAAVGREDLAKAWTLAHPTLKRECACTYTEWLTGNIPIQYYPTKDLDGASFSVYDVSPGSVTLEVLLLPPKDSQVPAQSFYIGLKQVGGKTGPWKVDYWAPSGAPPVPLQPN